MNSVLVEIIINARDATDAGFESRDEIEEPLEETLEDSGLASVTGGGGGAGRMIIDVEVNSEENFDSAIALIRDALRNIGVPKSTMIRRYAPVEISLNVYIDD